MISANEQFLCRATPSDQLTSSSVDYRAVAFTFCKSLIKDAGAAEQIVDAVFAEMQEEEANLQTRRALEAYLFVQLRNKCLVYLRMANRSQLLRAPSGEPVERPNEKTSFWTVLLKENFLIRPILRFF